MKKFITYLCIVFLLTWIGILYAQFIKSPDSEISDWLDLVLFFTPLVVTFFLSIKFFISNINWRQFLYSLMIVLFYCTIFVASFYLFNDPLLDPKSYGIGKSITYLMAKLLFLLSFVINGIIWISHYVRLRNLKNKIKT